jgi:hypothetical protein|tara:strand:- start:235 stop:513 length:279 start_codon:yes stop_codon:yes gene_type:complete
MDNTKTWQKNSDEWVEMMHKSNERKQKRMREQGYKVEIIFTQSLEEGDPFDWIAEAMTQGHFKDKTNTIHATSVAPIDLEGDEYKWLRDARN